MHRLERIQCKVSYPLNLDQLEMVRCYYIVIKTVALLLLRVPRLHTILDIMNRKRREVFSTVMSVVT
jgi:hypothetical protein